MKRIGLLCFGIMLIAVNANAGDQPEGSYMIPAGAYMGEAVSIDLTRARFSIDAENKVKLAYEIPKALAGKSLRIVLKGTMAGDGPWTLTGAKATAACKRESGELSCTLFYVKTPQTDTSPNVFDIDIKSAARHIDRMGLSEARAASLKSAGMSLMHEAIGIVTFFEN